jgi:hypothetical protein
VNTPDCGYLARSITAVQSELGDAAQHAQSASRLSGNQVTGLLSPVVTESIADADALRLLEKVTSVLPLARLSRRPHGRAHGVVNR